jgi:hypothetical protein
MMRMGEPWVGVPSSGPARCGGKNWCARRAPLCMGSIGSVDGQNGHINVVLRENSEKQTKYTKFWR